MPNQIITQNVTSRSGQRLKPVSEVKTVCSPASRAGESDTLYYAIDVENDGGFMLIAAPNNVEPVIAIIEEGSFDDPENLKNESYQEILSLMTENLKDASVNNDPNTVYSLLPLLPADTYTEHVTEDAPRVEVAWNQGWLENSLAPNHVAGCAPVAMAMLLSYFEQPTSITYLCSDIDTKSQTLDWKTIKTHKRSYPNDYSPACGECPGSSIAHAAISRLIRELGHRANSTYYVDYSKIFPGFPDYYTGTKPENMAPVIKELTGKDYYTNGTTFSGLYASLKESPGVALVAGYGVKSSTNVNNELYNHTWIADGYKEVIRIWRRHIIDSNNRVAFYTEEEIFAKLMHFNWGYSGRCNGYFNIANLDGNYKINPNAGYKYDSDLKTIDDDILYTNYVSKYWLYK